jgi:8-oxo-dGTP diphosphatase
MARQAVEIGSIGKQLSANLARLRKDRHASYTELSGWLKRIGRTISAETLGKIERKERRVDVDDLVALAVALDTTPNRLLLPGSADDAEPVELTPEVTVSALDAWKWATGEEPLPGGTAPPEHQILVRDDRERQFTRENQPHNLPEPYFRNVGHDLREHPDVARMAAAVLMEARRGGMQLGALVRLVEHLDVQRRFGKLDDVVAALTGLGNGNAAVIAAIVTHRGSVLVGRRLDGEPPWTFIAGEQEPGEAPGDTIIREVKEETGLDIRPGTIIGEREHPATGRHMIYMSARPVRGTKIYVGDPAELAEVRWVSAAEADELLPGMFGPVRGYLAEQIGGVSS